ncbi:HEPACAM family member 2-like [Orbicella faveolata]|uniref:HEPACAM family member 2-like n=1 Tax=Orbicella faveolata TaxID=48498 RepID=UPI0009E2880B|nr:HEPACAM family member 2-like [Orbicella faveolata]
MPSILSEVPVIEKHPESCTVQLGRDCKLFCHVIGKNLKYRWYRRSRCLEGETSSVLHIRKAAMTDAGQYSCIISNDKESVITWATVDVISVISSPKVR